MTRKKIFIVLLLAFFCLLSAGAKDTFVRGSGSCVYTGYAPLKDKPITIYYYIPTKGDVKMMPILFSMHGTKRNGEKAMGYWRDLAERYGFIVLSPEYSKKYYDINAYNYGNVSEKVGEFIPRPKEQWVYNTVESIFDYFRASTGNLSDRYDIWGHSAGGQFVHRFLLCMPEARVHRAVSANAGTWTMVIGKNSSYKFGWPYSIKGTIFDSDKYLRPFFAREFYVTIGDMDTDTTTSDFPKYPAAMAQGPTRYARGKKFYKEARETALSMNLPFNWRRSIVHNSGHSGQMMVFGRRTEEGKDYVYDIDDRSHTAAFWLIYGDRIQDK